MFFPNIAGLLGKTAASKKLALAVRRQPTICSKKLKWPECRGRFRLARNIFASLMRRHSPISKRAASGFAEAALKLV